MKPFIHLEGKVAIITGASRGIGLAIAHRFAESGAKLVLASRKAEGVEAAAASVRERGGEALAVACHAGKPDEVRALVAKAVEHFGQVDVLINNAGTNPYFGPLLDVEESAWQKTFQVNLEGYFTAAREVASRLIARGARGSIVNITSVAGLRAAPLQGVYGMTKAAVVSMTRTLALELGPQGIRVNAIAPGLIETKLSHAITSSDEIVSLVVARTPLNRVGQPDEIAGGALYLASDASSFVTGHTLVIDGGMTIT
jgi:NAD(P)-dependent dehydrogenase (short-subunit alcohol dehydrogenase family)